MVNVVVVALSILGLAFICDSIPIPVRNATFPASELAALESLYNSTEGYQWKWNILGEHWNFTGYHDPCSEHWQGITCICDVEISCHVSDLYLINFNMRGRLPVLKNLTELQYINLGPNFLTSSIPADFLRWEVIERFQLESNQLTGTIPSAIWENATALATINLAYNYIEGTLPRHFHNNPLLQNVLLSTNSFDGSLPYFGNLPFLVNIQLEYNNFEGLLNDSFHKSVFLLDVVINNNQLTGTIPNMFANNTILEIFQVGYNYFSGSLDFIDVFAPQLFDLITSVNLFTGPIDVLCRNLGFREIYIDYNMFTGTLPSCVSEMQQLGYLIASYNQLTGTLPATIGKNNNSFLLSLEFNDNQFTGPLPDVSGLPFMEYILFQNNQLTGNVLNLIASSYDSSLLVFMDLSGNQLTGSLPDEIFKLRYLKSFSVATNCLDSYIPSNVCNRTTLQFLNLDGMGAASECQNRFFPDIPFMKSYGLTQANQGGIPECLFGMKRLNTLHLSGNAIEGSLPHDLVIGEELSDLSLSHNNLRGLIPLSLQQNLLWTSLDLSYNKFSGVLDSDFQVNVVNSSITLQVNRLSGHIPHSLKDVESINILSGNMFYCKLNRDSLPVHDKSYNSYQCGSSTFNQSMVAWGVLCFLMVIAVLVLLYAVWFTNQEEIHNSGGVLAYTRQCVLSAQEYLAMFDAEHNTSGHHSDVNEVYNFGVFLRKVRWFFFQLCMVACFVLMPLYAVLKVYYSNTTYVYAWVVSASYLSGVVPAVILLIVWSIMLVYVFAVFVNSTPEEAQATRTTVVKLETKAEEDESGMTWTHTCQSVLMVFFNCITITAFNGCYVYIVFEYNTTIITLAQIAVAISKLLWNFFIVVLCKQLQMQHAVKVYFLTFIVLFNSIIAPFLANAALDPNCFRNVLIAAEDVASSFPLTDCNPIDLESVNSTCGTSDVNFELVSSFQPPFIYSFECSSSFVTNYSSVYVFMFLFVSFISPVLILAIDKYLEAYKSYPSTMQTKIEALFYTLLKEPQPLDQVQLLFDNDVFLLKTVSKLSIFMTLGVVFSPLAVVVALAFVVDSLSNQLMIGRFLYRIGDIPTRELYRDVIAREVRGSSTSLGNSMLKLILPFAALFYSFFLFDTYGDAAGYKQALWCTILMALMPLVIWGGYLVPLRVSAYWTSKQQEMPKADDNIELSVCEESGSVRQLKQSIARDTIRNPLL